MIELSNSKVYFKLADYIDFQELNNNFINEYSRNFEFSIDRLVDSAVKNYQWASEYGNTEIKYPVPYMMACIWTAMEEDDARDFDYIRRAF